jgi:hypothetical protein
VETYYLGENKYFNPPPMKRPLVAPLARNATAESEAMAVFYEETLGFTPNSLFTMMHRPKIAAAFLKIK